MSQSNNNARAAMLQSSIMSNDPIEFMVGRKKYKVKRLGNWVSECIDKLVAKSQFVQTIDDKNPEQVINTMAMNRKVAPKCLSYMVLHNPIKVVLFHWIYWRYLHIFYGQEDYSAIMEHIYSGKEAQFFFRNMAFLQMNNTLTIEMTKADMKSIAQRHASEASTTSSLPSMGQ